MVVRFKSSVTDIHAACAHIQIPSDARLLDQNSNLFQIAFIMNSITGLSPKTLRRAADIQEKIQSLQEELSQLLGGEISTPAQATEAPKKRKVSAAGRARMKAAQLARWAMIKEGKAKPAKKAKKRMSAQGLANIRAGVAKRMAAKGKAASKPAKKAKKKFSAAANAARSIAAKTRWAKAKAQGKTSL